MNLKYLPIFIFVLIAISANAQNLLKGTVFEDGTSNRMANVFVRDNNSKQLTITDKKGNFSVRTETGHILIFESPGYISDTLYLADLAQKQIRMVPKTIALREVSINASRADAFDAHKEYPEVYTRSKLYVLSPSSWFGKEAVDARRLKSYFKMEAEERHIDEVFSTVYVGSLVPLKGKDLEDFITMYRPSYDFIMSNTGPSLAVYVNDCYKKFVALPPEKRKQQNLRFNN
jgi:hypothetical protein